MSSLQAYRIDPQQFLVVATNVLHRTLLEAPRNRSRAIFKDIARDRRVSVLDVQMEQDADVRFDLALDSGEYRGERLSFTAFRESVAMLVGALSETLRASGDIQVSASESEGSLVFGIPGVTRTGGTINVMVLRADLRGPGSVLLKLQYLHPDNYQVEEVDDADGGSGPTA